LKNCYPFINNLRLYNNNKINQLTNVLKNAQGVEKFKGFVAKILLNIWKEKSVKQVMSLA